MCAEVLIRSDVSYVDSWRASGCGFSEFVLLWLRVFARWPIPFGSKASKGISDLYLSFPSFEDWQFLPPLEGRLTREPGKSGRNRHMQREIDGLHMRRLMSMYSGSTQEDGVEHPSLYSTRGRD